MSEFAFFRFMSLNLLTQEEKDNKAEVISVTEEVLDAQGMECDSKIAKVSEETIRQILNEVRKRRRKRATQDNAIKEEQEAPITNRISD
jgi:CHASE3 domain sensor protein